MTLPCAVTPAPRIDQTLRAGAKRLETENIPVPRLTAEVLLAHALGKEKSFLYAHPECELTPREQTLWLSYLDERCLGRPTQYITGMQEFFGLAFRVTPDVLIPRPETELLVEKVLALLDPDARLLDVGTGSGCIAVAIKKNRPDVTMLASDISGAALAVAQENARRLGSDVGFFQADLVEALLQESLDAIVCNPPYVPLADLGGLQRELRFEPAVALFGGEQGLDLYRRVIANAAGVLRPHGLLFLELGYRSRAAVEEMFSSSLWHTPAVKADLAGIDRVLAVQKR